MTHVTDLQRLIEATRSERGFTTDPVRLVCLLAEEVGEVAAEVKKTWSPNYPELVAEDLGNELADAFVLISALASSFQLDLEQAVRSKFLQADGVRPWATGVNHDRPTPDRQRHDQRGREHPRSDPERT
ncbi:MAG: hypothetical protein AAGA93_18125 [Actinomycetota bacterium]